MSEPTPDGPYTDSIRSDSPSGVRGLWRQVGLLLQALSGFSDLVAAVQQLAADVAVIKAQLTYNPGYKNEAQDVTTLADFFRWVLGGLDDYGDAVNLQGRLISYDQKLTNLRLEVQYLTTLLVGPAVNPGEDFVGYVRRIYTELVALADAQGRILTAPSGETLKSLLSDIAGHTLRAAECCEDGGVEPPPNELNEPPVNFGCANPQRATSWIDRGTTTVGGETRYLWQPRFTTRPAGIAENVAAATGNVSYGGLAEGTSTFLCIAWNFNNNTVQPDAFGRNRSSGADTAANDASASGPVASGSTFILGGLSDELSNCSTGDPDDDWCGYIFRTVSATPPALNVWLSATPRTCAS